MSDASSTRSSVMVLFDILLIAVAVVLILLLVVPSISGISEKGSQALCLQKVALKVRAMEELESMREELPKAEEDITEELEVELEENIGTRIYCWKYGFWGADCEPIVDIPNKEIVLDYYEKVGRYANATPEDIFYLGPECGSIRSPVNSSKEGVVAAIGEEIDACWRMGKGALVDKKEGEFPCAYTLAVVINKRDATIDQCDIAKYLYLKKSTDTRSGEELVNNWGDRKIVPNDNVVNQNCLIPNVEWYDEDLGTWIPANLRQDSEESSEVIYDAVKWFQECAGDEYTGHPLEDQYTLEDDGKSPVHYLTIWYEKQEDSRIPPSEGIYYIGRVKVYDYWIREGECS